MNEIVNPREILAQSTRNVGSQATSIEQSRAVAEVQAAFTIAAHRPRDQAAALNAVIESCKMKAVAETAFFKFPRGGGNVTGETIHLAVELARCWGNISYSVQELERDDVRGMSEMMTSAIDLQTNATSRTSFIVPHRRDKEGKSGPQQLTQMRDIYENNANMGARRLRECIFRVLPTWLIEAAKEQCYETLAKGEGDAPLPVRIAAALQAFAAIGIAQDRIEAKLGATATFTPVDLANLEITYRSIRRKEIDAEIEFPRVATTATTAAIKDLGREPAAGPTAAESFVRSDGQEGYDLAGPSRKPEPPLIERISNAATIDELDTLTAAMPTVPDDDHDAAAILDLREAASSARTRLTARGRRG